MPGSDVTAPYQVRIQPLNGDWYDAADRYRAWFEDTGLLPDDPRSIPDW